MRIGARSVAAAGLLSAFLLLGSGGSPAAAQDIGSDCPVFPGQTHSQIIRGVEGRLEGDWALAIKTTERSAKRLKDKGEDPSQAILFAQVLTCLRDEVKAGRHADLVAAAKANPKPEPNTATNGRAQAGATTATTAAATTEPAGTATMGTAAAGAATSPPPSPAPSTTQSGIDISALAPGSATGTAATSIDVAPQQGTTSLAGGTLAAGAQPAPAPAVPLNSQPVIVSGGGAVALPGTAESYGGSGQPQVAALPASGGYVGQACNYFTRPLQETINGISHTNRYGEGEWVCHGGEMYACTGGAWEDKGGCAQYSKWEQRLSSALEVYPR